ncbi:unnamed protein product, partial [Heterotrigona itama]
MPLFCKPNWPRTLATFVKRTYARSLCKRNRQEIRNCKKIAIERAKESHDEINNRTGNGSSIDDGREEGTDSINSTITCKSVKAVVGKSTRVTKKQKFGYNNWVPGMYGYSWDMMVHVWDTVLVVIRVHDNVSNKDRYLDPAAWVQTNRWEKHGDMAVQTTQRLQDNLIKQKTELFESDFRRDGKPKWPRLSSNLSIYIDVWCSLNGRFQQRMFNPNVDLLTVDWHPYKLEEIQQHVYTWSNDTDVLFVADFPRMHLDNYISKNFTNVTLTVLEGEVTYSDERQRYDIVLSKGSSIPIETEQFHKITTTSAYPACYMYTCNDRNEKEPETQGATQPEESREAFPIAKEIGYKIDGWIRAFHHIADAFFNLL